MDNGWVGADRSEAGTLEKGRMNLRGDIQLARSASEMVKRSADTSHRPIQSQGDRL